VSPDGIFTEYGGPIASPAAVRRARGTACYCGIGTDLIDYPVTATPTSREVPAGTHIPIYPPDMIRNGRADYVLILPWNLEE
jgi:hypothetical protein